MDTVLLTCIAFVGYVAAGTAIGLYLGERGRRLDVQWTTNTLRHRGPVAVQEGAPAEERVRETIDRQTRAQMVTDLMRETGCAKRDAEADVDAQLEQLRALGAEAWVG